MADSREKELVRRLTDLTNGGKLSWKGENGNYLVELSDMIIQLFSRGGHSILELDGFTEITDSDLGYSGELSDLEMAITANLRPVRVRQIDRDDVLNNTISRLDELGQ